MCVLPDFGAAPFTAKPIWGPTYSAGHHKRFLNLSANRNIAIRGLGETLDKVNRTYDLLKTRRFVKRLTPAVRKLTITCDF